MDKNEEKIVIRTNKNNKETKEDAKLKQEMLNDKKMNFDNNSKKQEKDDATSNENKNDYDNSQSSSDNNEYSNQSFNRENKNDIKKSPEKKELSNLNSNKFTNPLRNNPISKGSSNGLSKEVGEKVGQEATKKVAQEVGKEAGKQVAKKASSSVAKKALMAGGWKIAIVVAVIIIVIVVLNMLLNQDSADEAATTAKKGKESLKQAYQNGQVDGTDEQIDYANKISNQYDSYIGYTSNQIDFLYNSAIDTSGVIFNTDKELRQEYKKNFGTKYYRNGAITIDDYREIYKHILNTEKYNFNDIIWMNYSHDKDEATKIEDEDLYVNDSLKLKYPNDDEMTADKFIDMVQPYLLNHNIPLAFFISNLFGSDKVSSRPSNAEAVGSVYEGINNSMSEQQNQKSSFAYQIIKHGMSDITVDQYQLKHYTLNTYYLDYDSTTYNDTFKVSVYAGFSRDTLDKLGEQLATVLNPYGAAIEGVTEFTTTSHENTTHTNTRWDENKKEDVMKENYVSDYSNYENVYYVSTAKAFDVVFKASFNYTKYNDDDAKKRIGSDSEYTKPSKYYVVDNESNKVDLNSLNGNNVAELARNYGGSARIVSQSSIGDVISTGEYRATLEVKCGDYVINDGLRYDVQRKWDDKVVPGSTSTQVFGEEQLFDFNENKEGDKYKSTIEKSVLSQHDDMKLYKSLVSDSKLNSIDILDSNPKVFGMYVPIGKSKYIGLGKNGSNSTIELGYDNVSELLKPIVNNNRLPYVYGISLGYEVDTMSSSSGFSTGSQLLKEYIRALEGGGATTEKDGKSYYTVLDVLGHPTVGYGLDLVAHPEWKSEIMSVMGVSSLGTGDLADVEICDKIEDDFRNAKLEKVKSQYESLGLKEYQIHSLVARTYNVGNVDGYGAAHSQYYNATTDDKYEQIYEQYKDNSGAVSEISSKADLNSALYTNYMSKPVTAQGNEGVIQGLVNRRMSEWVLFSLGYYDKLQKFWTAGGDGNFGGISVIDASGNVDQNACLELQSALQNEVFGGRLVAPGISVGKLFGNNVPTGSANTDSNGYLSDAYRSFFNTVYYYQCPWWSRGRANIYLHSVDPNKYNGQFIRDGLGNGVDLAAGVSRAYGIPLYNDVSQLRANSIISYDNGTSWGHTAYVEAVGNDYYVVSHCGSGKSWHGVSIVPKTSTAGSYRVNGFVCMDDLLAK